MKLKIKEKQELKLNGNQIAHLKLKMNTEDHSGLKTWKKILEF